MQELSVAMYDTGTDMMGRASKRLVRVTKEEAGSMYGWPL